MNPEINETIFDIFPEIESERLLFRQYKVTDATALFDIRTDEKVSKYMDSVTLQTVDDAHMKIQNIHITFKEKKGITWAIIDKTTNNLIGDFGIWRLDKPNLRGEIGYVLHPKCWGNGFMKETMKTLIQFAFNDLNLHSLEANVNPKNEQSKKLLLSMGFKLEAYFRENYYFDGDFLDSEIYCLIQSDIE